MSELAEVSLTTIYTKIKEIEHNQELNTNEYITIDNKKKYITPKGQDYILHALGKPPLSAEESIKDKEEIAENPRDDNSSKTLLDDLIKEKDSHIDTLKKNNETLEKELEANKVIIKDLTDIINDNIKTLDKETYTRMLQAGIEFKETTLKDSPDLNDSRDIKVYEANSKTIDDVKEDLTTQSKTNEEIEETKERKSLLDKLRDLFRN